MAAVGEMAGKVGKDPPFSVAALAAAAALVAPKHLMTRFLT